MSLGCDEAGGGCPPRKPLDCKEKSGAEAGNFCRACSVVAERAKEVCFAPPPQRGHTVGCAPTVETERPTNFMSSLLRTVGRAR